MLRIGDQFTHDFTLSRSVYDGFISIFNDRNELHTDAKFAKLKGFQSEVMHGNILNGFLSYFIGECLPLRNVIIHAQEIKFSKPVYLGDTLTLNAEVAEVFDSVKAVEFKFQFRNQSGNGVAKGKIQVGII